MSAPFNLIEKGAQKDSLAVDRCQGSSACSHFPFQIRGLGCVLIDFDPEADAGKGDCGEEVSCELVMAGRDASEVLELVEETFDEVALAVEVLSPPRERPMAWSGPPFFPPAACRCAGCERSR